MSLFGFGAEKQERPEWVLAYLEEAMILQYPFLLANLEGVQARAYLVELDENAGTGLWNLEGPLFANKGEKVELSLVFGELRIGATLQICESRPRTVSLELPNTLALMEQRKALRTRMSSHEYVDFTALTGLYEGVAFLGGVENLSLTGARLRISKALAIKTQAPLRLTAALLPVGQPFVVLKIKNLPKSVHALDLSGQVIYTQATSRHFFAGVQFADTSADAAKSLEAFLAHRVGKLPDTIPPRERRKKQERKSAPPEPKDSAQSAPGSSVESALASLPVPVATKEERSLPLAESSPVSATTRLKKRGRTLAILASEGVGERLQGFLQQEGYGRVLVAHKGPELMGQIQQFNPHLVFVDCATPLIQNLELLAGLKRALPEGTPVIMAVDDIAASRSPKVQNLGISRFLPRPYHLDGAFTNLLDQTLGLR
ncbi:MAG: response regulator [Holophaga sp.]|nr:response regulator [Holophaga sp.]